MEVNEEIRIKMELFHLLQTYVICEVVVPVNMLLVDEIKQPCLCHMLTDTIQMH